MSRSQTYRVLVVIPLVLWGLTTTAAADERENVWKSDFKSAWEESQKTGQPLLLHFYATWCGPCQMMERGVLNSAETLEQIRSGMVAVKIDSDRHPELVQQFGIQALPSDVIVDPSGQVLTRSSGYVDRANYVARMSRVRGQFEQDRKVQIARSETVKPQAEFKTDVERENTAIVNEPTQLVGLQGYSPVSLSTSRTWVRGNSQFAAEYQEVVYWMSNEREYEQFRANPSQFAPKLLGCDPVLLWETDKAIAGSTEYGAYFDGNLYLFNDRDSRERFKKNPIKYVQTRHVLRLEDVELTRIR